MIRGASAPPESAPDARARALAVQFRDWLGRSMGKAGLAFDDAGVLAIHTLIAMRREEILALGGEDTGRWVVGMAAFLGECIRARFGGRYAQSGAEGLALVIRAGLTVYPIRWVHGSLVGGDRDSLVRRYEKLAERLGGGKPGPRQRKAGD
jgi:hypothetical protein